MADKPKTQSYIVTNPNGLSSADGRERWVFGSLIELDDERARIHLEAENVAPMDKTTPPTDEVGPATVVIHEAPASTGSAAEDKPKGSKGDALSLSKGKGD